MEHFKTQKAVSESQGKIVSRCPGEKVPLVSDNRGLPLVTDRDSSRGLIPDCGFFGTESEPENNLLDFLLWFYPLIFGLWLLVWWFGEQEVA